VHTSAKARLTSVAIRIRIRIRDPNHHQNLIICSLAHCQPFLKISCKSVQTFSPKVANRQTNNDDYISSLAEIITIQRIRTLNGWIRLRHTVSPHLRAPWTTECRVLRRKAARNSAPQSRRRILPSWLVWLHRVGCWRTASGRNELQHLPQLCVRVKPARPRCKAITASTDDGLTSPTCLNTSRW